ncbi:MAG: TPM domain-containing protein [Ilumatobacteraceae bacterium]
MTSKRFRRTFGAALFIALATLASCSTSTTETFPSFTAPVVDAAGAVDDSVEASLSAELETFRSAAGPQIAIAVIETTGNSSIENYSIDLARRWEVGNNQQDDGVLILVALTDKKLRIEVGSGIEGELTDIQAGRIVDEVMLPLLRADDVNGAVVQGARAVMSVWRGEQLPEPTFNVPQTSISGAVSFILFLFCIASSILLAVFWRFVRHTTWTSDGSRRGYGGIFIPGGFSGGGFGGGGFSGGGFSGGGGGGFSGGGAGGSW